MRQFQTLISLFLLCGLASSCSSSGDPASMAKCREMVATFCDRVGECHDQTGALTERESLELAADCKGRGSDAAHCETATSISDGYDACVSAIRDISCTTLVSSYTDRVMRLPSQCSAVVTFTR